VICKEVCQQYGVVVIGQTSEVAEQFFAISVERRLTHPAVRAISSAARDELFAPSPQ
jgi:LysR family transcriptional activator of nhaA